MANEHAIARWQESAECARRKASLASDQPFQRHWQEIADGYDRLMRSAAARHFRMQAERCRQFAQSSHSSMVKGRWLRQAEDYDRRARDAECLENGAAERTDAG
jgi:hypothetical protein